MKLIFAKAPPLGLRLIVAIILSFALMLSDGNSMAMITLRNMMNTAVDGLYYLANTPRIVLDNVSDNFVDTSKLQIENRVLKEQLREQNANLLLLDHLKVENQRLRLLLNSPLRTDEYKKIGEVLTAETDTYRQQIVINQGHRDGAYIGQTVIDEKGVVGQIISVGENSSRVLLITDIMHAIPVQVLRNDVRIIASGTGRNDELVLDNVPRSVDIVQGDLLVSSGLGGRFPEGYPVGIVSKVSKDGSNYFATVTVKPLASFERLRYILLVWPDVSEVRRLQSMSPEEVRQVVKERNANQHVIETNKESKNIKPKVTEDDIQHEIIETNDESMSPANLPEMNTGEGIAEPNPIQQEIEQGEHE